MIRNPGIAVAGDLVVAAHPLELVEGRSGREIGRGAVEIGRHIGIVEIGAADRLDRNQRIGSDRGVAHHRAGRHVDADAGDGPGIGVIDRLVEAAAAIERVIAGAAIKDFGR